MRHTLVLVLFGVLALPHLAVALPVDFTTLATGLGGNLNTNNATVSGVRADAFYLSGGAYTQSNLNGNPVTLFIRNEGANDAGLGVCGPTEQSSSDCNKSNGSFTGGGGDTNELSKTSCPTS